jgi:hypothetical protein
LLSNNDLRCLTQDGMFLHDGVSQTAWRLSYLNKY